ncbi:MAG: hypothetical protein ACRECM_08200, partial [Methyloceanibacter sp.]
MARMNAGYGSELHLLRMLGRHRQSFDRQVLAETGANDAWPIHRPGPNWDAIGRLSYPGRPDEWLLLEAKANLEELSSNCQAIDPDSLTLIRQTMDETKTTLGVSTSGDWMRGYYQHCNRLAALSILNSNGSPARL